MCLCGAAYVYICTFFCLIWFTVDVCSHQKIDLDNLTCVCRQPQPQVKFINGMFPSLVALQQFLLQYCALETDYECVAYNGFICIYELLCIHLNLTLLVSYVLITK